MSIKEDVARRVSVVAQIERLTEEKAAIDERLRQEGLGVHDAGDWSVSISPNRRLDAERFTQRFPVAQYPSFYKPVPDLQAIKDSFAPVELDQWYAESTPIVKVK